MNMTVNALGSMRGGDFIDYPSDSCYYFKGPYSLELVKLWSYYFHISVAVFCNIC